MKEIREGKLALKLSQFSGDGKQMWTHCQDVNFLSRWKCPNDFMRSKVKHLVKLLSRVCHRYERRP
jgi:hypothetical protein